MFTHHRQFPCTNDYRMGNEPQWSSADIFRSITPTGITTIMRNGPTHESRLLIPGTKEPLILNGARLESDLLILRGTSSCTTDGQAAQVGAVGLCDYESLRVSPPPQRSRIRQLHESGAVVIE